MTVASLPRNVVRTVVGSPNSKVTGLEQISGYFTPPSGVEWPPKARGAPCVGETRSGPVGKNLFRRRDLLRGTGKTVFAFSGLAGDMNLDGFEAAVLHPQAELFVNFLDAVLLKAIAHALASGRDEHIAM